jgi:DNA-binding MarR family transcriptional regulator
MTTGTDPARIASDLRAVLGHLVRRVREQDQIPPGQAAALGHLDRNGPMTTSDLAAAQHVRPQSAARTVAQLTEAGLIGGQPHPTDGRKTLHSPTEAGRAVLNAERGRRAGWLADAITTEFTESERHTLADAVILMNRLADL